jgi:hypothetical protein
MEMTSRPEARKHAENRVDKWMKVAAKAKPACEPRVGKSKLIGNAVIDYFEALSPLP